MADEGNERAAMLSEPDFDGSSGGEPTEQLSRKLDALLAAPHSGNSVSSAVRLPPLYSVKTGEPFEEEDEGQEPEQEPIATSSPVGIKEGLKLPPLTGAAAALGEGDAATSDEETQFDAKFMATQFNNKLYRYEQAYTQRVLDKSNEELAAADEPAYGGILSNVAKAIEKRRNKKRMQKLEQKEAVAGVKKEQHRREAERLRQKLEGTPTTDAPLLGAPKSREEKLRMQAIIDQRKSKKHTMAALNGPEKILAQHFQEYVVRSPGASLAPVEAALAKQTAALPVDERQHNYLGALALGVAFARVRSTFEADKAVDHRKLRELTDSLSAQQGAPMSAANATLFAHAALEYAQSVRQRVTAATADEAKQEEMAAAMGTTFADALLSNVDLAEPAWGVSHPGVALVNASERLFGTLLGSVAGESFTAQKLGAFWQQPLTPADWKATTLAHFA